MRLTGFQAAVIAIFAIFALVGVVIFSRGGKGGADGQTLEVSLWGTLPSGPVEEALAAAAKEFGRGLSFSYQEIREEIFTEELLEAVASGRGPDLIFLPASLIVRHENKVLPISYENLSARDFKDAFIEGGEIFLRQDGILGLPFAVDPLVLYWNRDLIATAGLTRPPRIWEEVLANSQTLTKSDEIGNILQSPINLGGVRNNRNMSSILAALFLQGGDSIVVRDREGRPRSVLAGNKEQELSSAAALRFYSQFADPRKEVYAWHAGLPEAADYFASGKLALYLGFASEAPEILARNPHLNFDAIILPYSETESRPITFGRIYAISALRSGSDPGGALAAAFFLAGRGPSLTHNLAEKGLPSARRDVLAEKLRDPLKARFSEAALGARAWLDPAPEITRGIFGRMVENVSSGRESLPRALRTAGEELSAALEN